VKKILITGSTGLVGKSILSAILEQDMDIYCLGRHKPSVKHKNLKFIKADFSNDPKRILSKLPKVDVVIHGAAYMDAGKSGNESILYQKVNVVFTEALFRHCRDTNVSKVIYISTFAFLKKPLLRIIDEKHPIRPLTPYAISKHQGELLLFKYADKHYKGVALRIPSPLPQDYQDLHGTVVKKWIESALDERPIEVFGDGSRTQDFVSTKDVARAVINAIFGNDVSGTYNIASGKPLSMRRLSEIISRHFNNTKVIFVGNDTNENDQWNISIKKAEKEIDYAPRHKPEEAIQELLKTV